MRTADQRESRILIAQKPAMNCKARPTTQR